MRKKIAAAVANIALLGGAMIFCLLLLEVGLRLYNPFPFRVKGNRIVLTGNRVETYRSSSPKLEPVITVGRNSLGFRGPNPPSDPDRYLSIVTVGGSTTECRFISDSNTWPAVLDRQLQREFSPLWLNNAGLDGHSTFGHMILLRDHLLRLKPKVIVFLVGINDQAAAAPRPLDMAQFKGIHARSPWYFLLGVVRNSELLDTLYNISRYSLARKAQLATDYIPDLKKLAAVQLPEPTISEAVSRHERLYLPAYRQRLLDLVNTCKEHGIRPVLITQPLLWGSGIDDVTGVNLETIVERPPTNGKLDWSILEAYNRTTLDMAGSSGVLGIDLANKLPKSSRLFYDGCHYTSQGATEVGNIVATAMSPWLAREFPQYIASRP